MPLQLVVGPTVEPLTLDEVKEHLRIDAGNLEPEPGPPTVALVSPAAVGNVDDGDHRYLVTFVTSVGQTAAGTPSSAVTVADQTVNGQVALTAIAVGGSAVTARKIYRTLAGGSTYFLLATIANNTATTYTDNIDDASLGVGAPSSNTTGDPELTRMIAAARRSAEHETNRKLCTQQWKLLLDHFPGGRWPSPSAWGWNPTYGYVPTRYTHNGSDVITLPFPPVQTVDSVEYYDSSAVLQTLVLGTDYVTDTASEPARIFPAYGAVWPDTDTRMNAVEISFTVGFGLAVSVPEDIKHWMLCWIAHAYEHRGSATELKLTETPFLGGLLDPHRLVFF